MNIYLIRHGETDWNRKGLLQGHTNIPLNQNGKEQMRETADKLVDLHLDLIITSPLMRARESAEIIADRLDYKKENIIVEDLLIERYFGVGEGLGWDERNEKYPGDNYPEMESFEDLINRAHTLFDKVINNNVDAQNILLVGHGAILYAILTAITLGKIEYGGKLLSFHQGSIYLIRYLGGNIELAGYNREKLEFTDINF